MIINDLDELKNWLDQNYWFEDGYISKIESDDTGLIITIGLQIKGTYVAGKPKTLREYKIKPHGLKKWTFDNSKFTPGYDWCIEGVDIIENDFGLQFDTPAPFELICEKIEISEPKLINTYTKPWTSKKEIFISIMDIKIPKPKDWIDKFKDYDTDIGFRVYADNFKDIKKIPYPDYSGYYIQKPDRINLSDKGIFIKQVKQLENEVSFVFELQDDDLKTVWSKLHMIISDWNNIKVNSGNVTFNKNEWKDFVEKGILPRELNKIKNVC